MCPEHSAHSVTGTQGIGKNKSFEFVSSLTNNGCSVTREAVPSRGQVTVDESRPCVLMALPLGMDTRYTVSERYCKIGFLAVLN